MRAKKGNASFRNGYNIPIKILLNSRRRQIRECFESKIMKPTKPLQQLNIWIIVN
jgi:hypothetical protein